jgi:dihydropteroate synthase
MRFRFCIFTSMKLNFPDSTLDLNRSRVMGILNVTPDSFSDGGLYAAKDAAVKHALQMVEAGADIIDIGGESTRPGAQAVSVDEELERVVPVLEGIRAESAVPVSVDTSKPEVMRVCAAAGASMINDVRALMLEGAIEAAADVNLPVCLMHMQGEPRSMQTAPHYDDVVGEVHAFLQGRLADCVAAGIASSQVVIDPGFGFGKTLAHNLALFDALDRFAEGRQALLVGVSRKSMIGKLLGDETRDRLAGSVTLALAAARHGAHIVRVHDVQQTVDALRIEAVLSGTGR